ncbi:MAG: hypothetical protein NTX49_05980 [Chlamydiae bacterium]|nr:hypothetical protein [Chlamydiota bacterium]
MKKGILFSVLFLSVFSYGEEIQDSLVSTEGLTADNQAPDLYDRPYSLNPVPINPRTPEPANWKEAYSRICDSIKEIQTRLDLIQARVRTIEDESDVTDGNEG